MNWILLRGLGRESGHWSELPVNLAQAPGVEQVHCIDLPGNGVFHQQNSPWSISGYTRHVMEQARSIPPPYTVVGLSLGGMVALDWAQRDDSDTIAKLVLINTSTGFNPFYQRARYSAYPTLLKSLLPGSMEQRERKTLALISNLHVDDPQILQRWIEIQSTQPVKRSNILRQLVAAARYRPRHRPPSCPGLLLASQRDRLVNPACSERLSQMWRWPLECHPRAGHDLPLDDGAWVIDKMTAFVGQNAPVSSKQPGNPT